MLCKYVGGRTEAGRGEEGERCGVHIELLCGRTPHRMGRRQPLASILGRSGADKRQQTRSNRLGNHCGMSSEHHPHNVI